MPHGLPQVNPQITTFPGGARIKEKTCDRISWTQSQAFSLLSEHGRHEYLIEEVFRGVRIRAIWYG